MTTLSELITTLKGKMLPLTGGTLSGNLEIGGNATVSGKNIVRSINGTVAGTDGNVTLSIPSAYTHPATHPASMITGLATVATSGKYSDLSGKPSLATVATSGNYNDLSNRPSIPSSPNAYVTSKWRSGTSWYRKWSNGWIEQGGNYSGGASVTINFPTSFSNTNYNIVTSGNTYFSNKKSSSVVLDTNVNISRKQDGSYYAIGY